MLENIFEARYFVFSKNNKNETKPLQIYKTKIEPYLIIAFYYLKSFVTQFLKSFYKIPFILIWLFNFNVFSILLEFLSWCFGWSIAPSGSAMLTSISTFIIDMIILFLNTPFIVWFSVVIAVIIVLRKAYAYNKLSIFKHIIQSFIKHLGFNVLFEGPTGAGKTTLMTQSGILTEDTYHIEQYDSMYDCFIEFPEFPFDLLNEDITRDMDEDYMKGLHSARAFVEMKQAEWIKNPSPINIWGYTGPLYYNDGYRYVQIWEMIKDYTQLFFMYSLDDTTIISNMSVRSDLKLIPGYFPIWENNLLKRDSNTHIMYSRYSHIMDRDAYRILKPINTNSDIAGAIEFGVNLFSEEDKESGNQYTNKIYDINDEESNPLNDGFAEYLMFERHYSTVRFKCYLKQFADLQRNGNLNLRESSLFDKLLIIDKSEKLYALPLFFEKKLYDLLNSWFKDFTQKIWHYGQSRTLMFYLITKLLNPFLNYIKRTCKEFGYNKVLVQKEGACNPDGTPQNYELFIIDKIALSDRFASDCYNSLVDEAAKHTTKGLKDVPHYSTINPEFPDFRKQNSNFANKHINRIDNIKINKK